MSAFNEFLDGYKVAILFGEHNDDLDLDSCSIHEIDAASCEALRRDALQFVWQNRALLRRAEAKYGYSMEQAGHDLYFTAAGHGVGYWDRDIGGVTAELLTRNSGCGEYCPFFDDNGSLVIEFYRNAEARK